MQNKNVLRVGEAAISHDPEFKVEAIRAYLAGKPPYLVFLDDGFDLDLIEHDRPRCCLKRWRAVFKQRGEQGLRTDRRGKSSTGRPPERELTVEEKLRRSEARLRYLEKENEFLEKLDALERNWSKGHLKSTH